MRLRSIAEYLVSETRRYKLPVTVITTSSIVLTAANKDSYPRFVHVLRTNQAVDSLNQTGHLIGPANKNNVVAVVLSHPDDEDAEIAIWNLRRFRDRTANEIIASEIAADIFGATFFVERRIAFEDSAARVFYENQRIEYIWVETKDRYVRQRETRTNRANGDDVIIDHFNRTNGE